MSARRLLARHALLPGGWARDVAIGIDADGNIDDVAIDAVDGAGERVEGPLVAAMPNVHSHAFQRALAGRTGRASTQRDDTFWTWRQTMYAFLDRLDADAFEAVAAQAYVEMAKAGYATVAEFHYVHHDALGKPYSDPAELAWRIVAAAQAAGLGLTLLPVFYAHGGFGATPTTASQRRFVHSPLTFSRLLESLTAGLASRNVVLGVAPHSLRAVTAEELGQVVRMAPESAPIHIHAAEQTREVDECFAATRMRPIEWLLTQANIDARWCVVHATHMTEREVTGLAKSGAVVGLAPTTEADLGDGTFPAEPFVAAGGRFAIGSDSNTVIDPFAELRQLEWSQRLRHRRRNVLAPASGEPVGAALWTRCAHDGARALGRRTGAIIAGARADFVVLDTRDPALAGQDAQDVLDSAIFGPSRRPVRDVMSAGAWIVREGRHPREDDVGERYRAVLAAVTA